MLKDSEMQTLPIMMDSDDITSQSTTKISNFQQTNSKIVTFKKSNNSSILSQKPDEDSCRCFNSDLMRSLMAKKMCK